MIFFLICQFSFSQDIDIFQKKQNDNFKFENINPQMSINEYRILSRNLRMKEMLYATVVPGYVHFYINENRYGYGILVFRSVAYANLAYMALANKVDFSITEKPNLIFNEDNTTKTDIYLTYGAIGIILGSYFYDWIHGQYVLKKKQENIRYKYNMKMNLSVINNPNRSQAFGVSLNFQF